MSHDPPLLCDLKKIIEDHDCEISSQRQTIVYQQGQLEQLRKLLAAVQEPVCSVLCPSVWQSTEKMPHCDLCNLIREALK